MGIEIYKGILEKNGFSLIIETGEQPDYSIMSKSTWIRKSPEETIELTELAPPMNSRGDVTIVYKVINKSGTEEHKASFFFKNKPIEEYSSDIETLMNRPITDLR